MPKKTSHPGWLYLNLACSNSKYPGCHLLHSSSVVDCTNKLENWLTESRVMLFYCVSWLSSDREQARGVNLKLRPQKVKVGQAHSVSVSFPVGLSNTFLSEKRTKPSPDWLSHLDSLMNKHVIVESCPVCTVRSSNPGKAIKYHLVINTLRSLLPKGILSSSEPQFQRTSPERLQSILILIWNINKVVILPQSNNSCYGSKSWSLFFLKTKGKTPIVSDAREWSEIWQGWSLWVKNRMLALEIHILIQFPLLKILCVYVIMA